MRPARPVAVVAARHDETDACLLIAVVVVVRDEDVAEAVHTRLIFVTEIVSDQLQVLPIYVAAPDGAGLAIGVVSGPFAALAVGALQVLHALVADAEIELAVGANENAVHAVIVIHPAETAQQFPGRPVRLAVAVLVLEEQNVRRLADVDLISRSYRILRHGDSQRREQLRRLVERNRLIGSAAALLALAGFKAGAARTRDSRALVTSTRQ